jgi:hypothetical protein
MDLFPAKIPMSNFISIKLDRGCGFQPIGAAYDYEMNYVFKQ